VRLVVIGGVAAGLSAAARARRLDRSMDIVVLEKGETISQGLCGLPYYVEGQVQRLSQLVKYAPEQFARERNVEVRTQAEVVNVTHAKREVTLRNGERIHYDRLVIATGARSLQSGDPRVCTLHTLHDAERLKDFLLTKAPKSAAVVGGGYIGIEAAEALRAHGLRVAVYEAHEHLLGRADQALTDAVGTQLKRFRVDLHLNAKVAVESLKEDLIVLAAGVKPNIVLAQEAGIEIGRSGAIRVTERMETSINGIYAAGDCAESTNLITGRQGWVPLGTTANKMGRVAGANAAGGRERFPGIVGTSIVRVCGLGVAITGLCVADARTEGFDPVSVVIHSRDKAGYFRSRPTTVSLVGDRRTRRVIGGFVTGDDGVAGRINVIATAITSKMKVEEFEMLDLAYAPPFAPVWDPVLIAAQQLAKALDIT
jgi:NADPH-dependent 2,4-dienoyl-CoA reductase/sulfur reductase-like enzyme